MQIRAEERRQERQQQRHTQVNRNLLSLPPPPPPPSADQPSTSAEAGLTSAAGIRKPSVKPKKSSPSKTARWLAFKERKKAAKIAALSKPPPPPLPPLSSASSPEPPPDVVRSIASELQADLPPYSPLQLPRTELGDALTASASATGILPAVFSTANGSSISFEVNQPVDLDGIDIDELMLLENN